MAWADGNSSFVLGETVTGNYFDVLGIRPVLGRLLAPADDDPAAPRVAEISSRLWERLFGRDPEVMGRTLRVRARSYVVVGVAPPEFAGMPPLLGPDLMGADDLGRGPRALRHPDPRRAAAAGRDAAPAPRLPLDVRQGKASRRCHGAAGGRQPRRPHGRPCRRLPRDQRGPAVVVDADERRSPATTRGRAGVSRGDRSDAGGGRRPAGGVRGGHGDAARPFGGAAAGDRGAARHRREPAAPRAATVDGGPPAVGARRLGGSRDTAAATRSSRCWRASSPPTSSTASGPP